MISILILTYNRCKITESCVPVICNRSNRNTEILIWDNGSTDGTLDWLYAYSKSSTKDIKIFFSESNYGIESINFLTKEARGKYIIKVDDDMLPPKNYDTRLLDAYLQSTEKLAYVSWDIPWGKKSFAKRSGMRMYKKENGKIQNLKNHSRLLISNSPSKWMINGAVRFSSKEVFEDLGMHPQGKKYGVDHAVCVTAEKYGYKCAFLDTKDKAIHVTPDILDIYRDKTSTT